MISPQTVTRRTLGFGAIGFSAVLAQEGLPHAAAKPGDHTCPHLTGPHFFTEGQKRHLPLHGGQTDTFDLKPLLKKLEGQPVPESIAVNMPKIPGSGVDSLLMDTPFSFKNHGQCGLLVSELFAETDRHADDLCVIRSLNHRIPVHGPGECAALTGTALGNRPSMGALITYGFVSETSDLPAYVVMLSKNAGTAARRPGWGPGFVPSSYQGTVVDAAKGVPFTAMSAVYDEASRRRQLDFIRAMNEGHLANQGYSSELEARIASCELGYHMQTSAPDTFDLKHEDPATQKL